MIFTETKIKGVFVIEPELLPDERGFFARSFCKDEFRNHGLETDIVQCNISYNKKKGTLRGMHYQAPPFEEAKIVSCIKGSIYDVVLDLRRDSATCCQWVATELSETNFKMVYIPKGCAHGFQTIEDDTMVYYQMTEFYHPECTSGVRWDDPAFMITWPMPDDATISNKDTQYETFRK
ncbi:MAG: dTDP-4-dehydrorhamnose 3,5-epimerase [Methanomicrobiales archaeon HGW-Methanomicrobiales-3]|jgi:dTDP-4-dehydrorhamnose 3,5-epimerase|nr:MAG: dTDP-4-dehydrorhamnose 3,5-epimerase [Methanomicrobiales archaeon HGW-Methanomicrobiales-3]